MTIIDFLIIGSVGYSLYAFVSHQKLLSRSKASPGLIAVLLGLLLIALFYVADLVTMYIFPLFMPASAAVAAMLDLHLNYYWIVALFGISAIAFGFAATNQKIFHVIRKLHDSEERYAIAASGANDGLWDWNILTNESYFSPRWKQILGFEDHELENVRQTFTDALHPDDRDQVMAAVRTHLEERVPYDIEFRLRHKDGHYVWVRSKGQAIWGEQGNARRMAGSLGDITKRKETEEALRTQSTLLATTFESMLQGISVYDADFKLVAFNQSFIYLLGFPEDFVRLGQSFEEILRFLCERGEFGSEKIEGIIRERVEILRQDESWYSETVLANGAVLSLRVKAMPEGGFVSTFADITERKQAEEAHRKLEWQGDDLTRLAEDLQVALGQAEAANRAKSEFLAAMSHELRTPLNAIIGFSEIMKNETLGPVGSVRYRTYAEDIHGSGLHLLGLVNDILDLSKVESGADELSEEEFEIPEIAETVLRLVQQRAEKGGLEIEVDLQDDLPLLCADERKVRQILTNLLSNAIKFTEPGGKVTLSVWYRADSGVVFQIADTGIGIAPEDIPKALTRFGQVDSDLNRKYEGTGLGLPLTKALVELHGGYLDLQSQIGVGTTVTVRFPAARIVTAGTNATYPGQSLEAS